MKIYLDPDFKCHVENDGTMAEIETDSFGGKCKAYIEGYRLVPDGEAWTREDGVQFNGLMMAPWRPLDILEAMQRQYEEMLAELADMRAALEMLGVEANG